MAADDLRPARILMAGKSRQIFSMLLDAHPETVPFETMSAAIWDQHPPANPRVAFSVYVHAINGVLRDFGYRVRNDAVAQASVPASHYRLEKL